MFCTTPLHINLNEENKCVQTILENFPKPNRYSHVTSYQNDELELCAVHVNEAKFKTTATTSIQVGQDSECVGIMRRGHVSFQFHKKPLFSASVPVEQLPWKRHQLLHWSTESCRAGGEIRSRGNVALGIHLNQSRWQWKVIFLWKQYVITMWCSGSFMLFVGGKDGL